MFLFQDLELTLEGVAHMEMYCLDEGTLRLVRIMWNNIFDLEDSQDVGSVNREFRYAAYQQCTIWQDGRQGRGNWRPIPSCCVFRIRLYFPDPFANYTGYKEDPFRVPDCVFSCCVYLWPQYLKKTTTTTTTTKKHGPLTLCVSPLGVDNICIRDIQSVACYLWKKKSIHILHTHLFHIHWQCGDYEVVATGW